MDHKDLCEHTRIRLIAAAVGHQQCMKTASNIVQIPGGDRVIAIGTPAQVRALLGAAPFALDDELAAAQGSGVQAEPLFDPTTLTRYAPDRDGNMAAAYDGMYVTLSDVQDVAYAASPAPSAAPAMEDVRAMAEFIVNHAVADHTDTNGPDWHACACCAAEIPINGSTYQNLTLEHKDDCLFVKARAYLAAPAQVAQCKPVGEKGRADAAQTT
jgi:hypothetical protein